MLEVIISAVISFIGTNIDDLFVDTLFFAEAEAGETGGNDRNWGARIRSIVVGKYLGIGVLVVVSLLGAFGLQLLPGKYIGLLGFIPLGLGIKAGFVYFKERKPGEPEDLVKENDDVGKQGEKGSVCFQKGRSLLWSVALVTIANGADNIGVYIPLFAGYGLWQLGVLVCVFAVMIALWCTIAKRLADLPLLKKFLMGHKGVIVPVVFIALGVYIMVENFL